MPARLRAALGESAALGAAAVLALLAGCRTAPAPAPAVIGPGADAPWQEQYAALANLENYALTGRVAKLDGAAARTEIESRLGFELPLAELRWWLLGLPAPGAPAEKHEDAAGGAITDFQQNGWRVSIDSRAPGLGFSLPARLTAE